MTHYFRYRNQLRSSIKYCYKSYSLLGRIMQGTHTVTSAQVKVNKIFKRFTGGIKVVIEEAATIAKKEVPVITGATGSRPSSPINPHNLSRDPNLQTTPQNPNASPSSQPNVDSSPKTPDHGTPKSHARFTVSKEQEKMKKDLDKDSKEFKEKQKRAKQPVSSFNPRDLVKNATETTHTSTSQDINISNPGQLQPQNSLDVSQSQLLSFNPISTPVTDTSPKATASTNTTLLKQILEGQKRIEEQNEGMLEEQRRDRASKQQDKEEEGEKEKEKEKKDEEKEQQANANMIVVGTIFAIASPLVIDIIQNPSDYANTAEKENNPFSDLKDISRSSNKNVEESVKPFQPPELLEVPKINYIMTKENKDKVVEMKLINMNNNENKKIN